MRNLTVLPQGDREIVMRRTFDAPRERVFDAFTDPEQLRRWMLGPEGWSMPFCEVDLRTGGAYRYVWRNDAEGMEMGVSGVYREVVRPERLVHSENSTRRGTPAKPSSLRPSRNARGERTSRRRSCTSRKVRGTPRSPPAWPRESG